MLKKLPNYQDKQHILYIEHRSESNLIAFGNPYLDAGKFSDAIDFFQKANYIAGLEEIKGMAELSGDVMLFQQVLKPLKQTANNETWNVIGQKALELKKYSFALYAFKECENSAMIERIKEVIKSEENDKTA